MSANLLRRLPVLSPIYFFASLIGCFTSRSIPEAVIDMMLSQNHVAADKI